MKKLILFLTTTIVIGCIKENIPKENNNEKEKQEVSSDSIDKLEEKLNEIFGVVDSSKIVNSIGCIQGYFGHVSPKYVLKIPSSIYNHSENIQEYNFDKNELQCELLIFEQDSSHLGNICTDIFIINYPKPKRTIKSIQGKIKVFNSNPIELWGERVNNTYIKIEEIEFADSLAKNQIIKIKDKIFWEAPNLGVPG